MSCLRPCGPQQSLACVAEVMIAINMATEQSKRSKNTGWRRMERRRPRDAVAADGTTRPGIRAR